MAEGLEGSSVLLRNVWPGLGRRQGYYAEMDVVLTGLKQRSLSGSTVRLVPPGTRCGWEGVGAGLHM